jgi:hypothetical protein
MSDPSWAEWRKENGHPEPTAGMVKEVDPVATAPEPKE